MATHLHARHANDTRPFAPLASCAAQIYFLPNDPFAVCVCYGDQEQMPRLVWFNMQEEKLAAELSGKNATPDNLGFGRSGLSIPPVPIAALSADFTPPPIPTGMAGAVPPTPKRGSTPPTPSLAALGGAPPSPSPLPPGAEGLAKESSTAGEQAAAACAAMTKAVMESRPWPAVSFRDAYLVAGGPIVPSSSFRPPENEAPPPPDKLPQESHLYLYKIDAIARMLLPEEMANAASKSLLNRMLADLNPPKIRRSRVKMGVADPEAPKPPPSAMRKATDVAPDEAMGGRRHIKFNETDLEGLLNEEQKSGAWCTGVGCLHAAVRRGAGARHAGRAHTPRAQNFLRPRAQASASRRRRSREATATGAASRSRTRAAEAGASWTSRRSAEARPPRRATCPPTCR